MEYQTTAATIRLLETSILENTIHKDVILDVDEIMEIKRVNVELSQGQRYALLIDSGLYTSITEKGRELSASEAFSDQTIAKALLVHSLAQKIVGRFYLQINKPFIRTRVFTDRDQAIDWLKIQVNIGID